MYGNLNVNLKRILNLKNLKSFLWVILPILASILVHFIWLFCLGLIRGYFDFPIGDEGTPSAPTIIQLLIYNGIQLVFVLGLFFVLVKLFKKALHKTLENQKSHMKLWFSGIVVGWLIACYFVLVESIFFCCPGIMPEVIQPWYWLTIPEFGILGLIGLGYLIKDFLGK